MSYNLPYGSGLDICNERSLNFIKKMNRELIDGGVANCKQIDLKHLEILKISDGGKNLSYAFQAEWIISSSTADKSLYFNYINPYAGHIEFKLPESLLTLKNRRIVLYDEVYKTKFKIKISPSASKSIEFILDNLIL